MMAEHIFEAMGEISDEYISRAMERMTAGHTSPRALIRRVSGVLAAVLAALSVLTAAMAASPSLREAVFRLLRISQSETIAHYDSSMPSGAGQLIDREDLGSGVSVRRYVLGEHASIDQRGLIAVSPPSEYSASHPDTSETGAYCITEKGFTKIEPHSHVERTLSWDGKNYRISFDIIYVNDLPFAVNDRSASTLSQGVSVTGILGRKDVLLIALSRGERESRAIKPYIFNIDTDKAQYLFEGFSKSAVFDEISHIDISSDLKRAVISAKNGVNLCDLELKTARLIDSEATVGWFTGEDTVCTARRTGNPKPHTEYISHELSTGRRLGVAESFGSPYEAHTFFGKIAAAVLHEDGTVALADLRTGEQVGFDGITISGGVGSDYGFIPNTRGDKLLMYERRHEFFPEDGKAYYVFTSIGLADIKKQTFTLLDREPYFSAAEYSIGMMGDSPFIAASGEGEYLYIYDMN